jgi:general secretion pathway protein N
MRWNILGVGLSVSLAISCIAAAQTRLAATSSNVVPDPLDSPPPSFSRPPPAEITQPGGPGRGANPGFGVPPRPTVAAPEPRGNPLWAIPLKALTFTRERPLFTPSRRPPTAPVTYVAPAKPVAASTTAEPELPKLTLIGVILGEKDGIGIFVDGATHEVIRLRKNEGHGGWVLRTLEGRQATLQKATSTAVLVIPPPGGEPVPAVLLSGSGRPRANGPAPRL